MKEKKTGARVGWKGDPDGKALSGMGRDELESYVMELEAALYSIHTHFFYSSPSVDLASRRVSVDDIGYDGQWKVIGMDALKANLLMYEKHSTAFCPVPRPKGAGNDI